MLRVAVLILYPALISSQTWDASDTRAFKSVPINIFVNETDKDNVCNATKCLRKCCPEGEHFISAGEENICKAFDKTLDFSNISLYGGDDHTTISARKLDDVFSIVPNMVAEYDPNLFIGLAPFNSFFNLYLDESGDLYLETPNAYNRWKPYNTSSYCIDYNITTPDQPILQFWILFPEGEEEVTNLYYTSAMLVSCVFLVLVLLVYCLLPDLRNLGGKILMAYVFSLLFAFIWLAILQLGSFDQVSCVVLSSFIYFFFLASFCWMNVMSYDIFWTFRGYAKARRIHRRGQNFKFMMYCLYAFGVPLAMTVMFTILNSLDLRHMPWIITPQIPEYGCFLTGEQQILYLYVPMFIMIICNFFFFGLTVFNICRLSRGTAMLHSAAAGNEATHRAQRNRFKLYLKLSLVMGINWVLEVISSLYPHLGIWWVSDLYNLCIGISIFFIFVFKKKIYEDLKKRLNGIQLPSSMSRSHNNSTIESNLSQDMTIQMSRNPSAQKRYP